MNFRNKKVRPIEVAVAIELKGYDWGLNYLDSKGNTFLFEGITTLDQNGFRTEGTSVIYHVEVDKFGYMSVEVTDPSTNISYDYFKCPIDYEAIAPITDKVVMFGYYDRHNDYIIDAGKLWAISRDDVVLSHTNIGEVTISYDGCMVDNPYNDNVSFYKDGSPVQCSQFRFDHMMEISKLRKPRLNLDGILPTYDGSARE